MLDHLDKLGVATSNASVFPLIELTLANAEDLHPVGRHLFDRGIYVTPALYPVVPRDEVGFRIHLTAANTAEQVDHLLTVLQEVDDRFRLPPPPPLRRSLSGLADFVRLLAFRTWVRYPDGVMGPTHQ